MIATATRCGAGRWLVEHDVVYFPLPSFSNNSVRFFYDAVMPLIRRIAAALRVLKTTIEYL